MLEETVVVAGAEEFGAVLAPQLVETMAARVKAPTYPVEDIECDDWKEVTAESVAGPK